MKETTCLFCNHLNYRVLYDNLPDLLTKMPGRFRLVRCNDCQLVYLNPVPTPDELATYYPQHYEPYLMITPKAMTPLKLWLLNYGMKRRALPVLRHKTRGRLLDLGCATGHYLNYVKSHSHWQVQGVELDQTAAEFARQQFDIDVYTGELHNASFDDEYFDAVSMWDVLEHLANPIDTLREIRRILKPDGILIFRVPIIDSLDAKLFGRYWAGLDVPRHLYIYSKDALFRLLQETELSPLRTEPVAGSFFPFVISMQFGLEDRFGDGLVVRSILRLMRSMPARALTFPYFYLVERLKLGPQLTVLAVRQDEPSKR